MMRDPTYIQTAQPKLSTAKAFIAKEKDCTHSISHSPAVACTIIQIKMAYTSKFSLQPGHGVPIPSRAGGPRKQLAYTKGNNDLRVSDRVNGDLALGIMSSMNSH